MAPHLPIEDPSDRSSLVDRTTAYVWGSRLLRVVFILTVINHVAAILLVLTGAMAGFVAGLVGLFSVLAWFFAVLIPVMNREVRVRFGVESTSHWGDVSEMFCHVALCFVTVVQTVMVVHHLL